MTHSVAVPCVHNLCLSVVLTATTNDDARCLLVLCCSASTALHALQVATTAVVPPRRAGSAGLQLPPDWRALHEGLGWTHFAAVPLLHDDVLHGALCIFRERPLPGTSADIFQPLLLEVRSSPARP